MPTPEQVDVIQVLASLAGFVAGVSGFWIAWKKAPHDVAKTVAETKQIYQQIADGWAKQVEELQLDINQVRRENESYRIELSQRDQIIEDLKDWAARLTEQVKEHAPQIIPAKFFRRRTDDAKQSGKN